MQVHKGLNHLPHFKNAVLTIGSFDGVHHGHRMIIQRLIQKAKEVSGESVILTFDPHPRQVVFPSDDSLRLLNTLEEKIALLQETDLDHLVIAPFTIEFSQVNPYRYVDQVLIEKLRVKHLIIGYDHKFGLNREGDIDLLNIYARQEKFTVEEIPKQEVDNLHVSSSKIRNHILNGKLEKANKLLGAPYPLTGKVTKGSQIAGALGYPTANCLIKEKTKLIPVPGTYAATATCEGEEYEGMLYIGKSPTLRNRSVDVIEINLFAQLKYSLYGKQITIRPERQFRGDQKFSSKEELQFNIGRDKLAVEHYFKNKRSNTLTTIAILNYNGKHHLAKYLPSYSSSSQNSIVVIDNHSVDESKDFIKDHYPQIRWIANKENYGFAEGYNKGIYHIGSKYTAILNSDVQVTEGWLKPIIELLESNSKVAAVQPKILAVERPGEFEYAGAAGGLMDLLGYPFCRGRILSTIEDDDGQYDLPKEVAWTSGAAMVVRTELFKLAGGFDPSFFAHQEEIDLCLRLRQAGYSLFCLPQSVVYHLGGGTLDYNSPKKIQLNLRNNYWMILKNFPIMKLLWVLPLRMFFDLGFIALLLLQFKFSHFKAALSGFTSGISEIFGISNKRREISYFVNRCSIGEKNQSGVLSVFLPISYFIFRKRKLKNYN